MTRKSVVRFSIAASAGRVFAEIMRSKNLKRDGDLTQSHRALVDQMVRRSSSN
jgi:hypothetical protein